MNINNINKAVKIKERIDNNSRSLGDVIDHLKKYPNGSSDGTCTNKDGRIYGLRVGENRDRTGFNLELSGSLIQTEVLLSIKELLLTQIEKDKKVIEEL